MDTKVLKNDFRVGDIVYAKFNKAWSGPMTVDYVYGDACAVVHPEHSSGAFYKHELELDVICRSPLWEALK